MNALHILLIICGYFFLFRFSPGCWFDEGLLSVAVASIQGYFSSGLVFKMGTTNPFPCLFVSFFKFSRRWYPFFFFLLSEPWLAQLPEHLCSFALRTSVKHSVSVCIRACQWRLVSHFVNLSPWLLWSLFNSCMRWSYVILFSRKFSSAKYFVRSDRQAVRQEFIFVKRRSSLFCLSFIFTFMNISDPTLVVYEKN